MEEELVSYDIALALKELGFDQPCFAWYKNGKRRIELYWNTSELRDEDCLAPTYSQAFRWFREKMLCDCCVYRYQSINDGNYYYCYVINYNYGTLETKHFKEGFLSYEEAEQAALLEMIAIIKNK